MTKLAQLITLEEGGWKLFNGKLVIVPGTLPARDNNPGDLRHSPHSQHPGDPNAIGVIDTLADGIADLERQLQMDAVKYVSHDPVTGLPVTPPRLMQLRDAIYSWAPPNENNSASYLEFVVNGFGGRVSTDTPLSAVLEIPA